MEWFLVGDYLFYASSVFFFFCLPPGLNPWEGLEKNCRRLLFNQEMLPQIPIQ